MFARLASHRQLLQAGLVTLMASSALVGVASQPAAATLAGQIPCGDRSNVKVFLKGGAQICFARLGQSDFNKMGVYRLEAGVYGGVVKVPRRADTTFAPGEILKFDPPVNPTFINLTRIDRPAK